LRSGVEIGKPVMKVQNMVLAILEGPKKRRKSKARVYDMRGEPRQPKSGRDADVQETVDAILDKISQKGYDSLSEEEKEFLYQASKK